MVAEAVVVCERSGADPRVMFDICSRGGGDSRMLRMMLPKALDGDYSGLQFALSNARKDIGYYTRMAADAGVDSALGSTVHTLLSQAVENGYADQYIPALIEAMRQRADGPARKKA
jgi:3-hydroxyisobutyrate dehydrogenase-like beta-hydroxyacid dehydrogenase